MNTQIKANKSEKLALDTLIKIKRAINALDSVLRSNFKNHNLSESQFGVLEAIYHLGPLTQKELASKILKSGGNLTMVIDNLEKRKLVLRKSKPNDRRSYIIDLSSNGKELIKNIFPNHVKAVTEALSILSPDEQSSLGNLCKKLGLNLKKENSND